MLCCVSPCHAFQHVHARSHGWFIHQSDVSTMFLNFTASRIISHISIYSSAITQSRVFCDSNRKQTEVAPLFLSEPGGFK